MVYLRIINLLNLLYLFVRVNESQLKDLFPLTGSRGCPRHHPGLYPVSPTSPPRGGTEAAAANAERVDPRRAAHGFHP